MEMYQILAILGASLTTAHSSPLVYLYFHASQGFPYRGGWEIFFEKSCPPLLLEPAPLLQHPTERGILSHIGIVNRVFPYGGAWGVPPHRNPEFKTVF
jgi:hypothetical protein